MRKMLDKKFLIIVSSTLIVLILLALGSFTFFKDREAVFQNEGYILDNLSSENSRYYFDDNTTYKKNLSSNIVFKDVDQTDVEVSEDSFVHYTNGDIGFLKNGALVDLGTISKSTINFYNIGKGSILNYRNRGYYVKTASGNVTFDNFMGRISDNKYIIAGKDIRLKASSSDTISNGDYFEIVFNEKGIVNIENQEVKYQLVADGSYIYVGDLVIDLGNKSIMSGDKVVMSISAITIDGNENIDIVSDDKYKDDKDSKGDNDSKNDTKKPDDNKGTSGNGTGTGDGNGNGTTDDGKKDDSNGTGSGDNNGNSDTPSDIINSTEVSLVKADVGASSIGLTLNVNSKNEDAVYNLYMTNVSTGKRVYSTTFIGNGERVIPTKYSLTPDTNYLITVEVSGTSVFQTMLKTKDMGVVAEKMYATSDSLTYNIKIDKNSSVNSVVMNLYKYDSKKDEYVLQKDASGNNLSAVVSKDSAIGGYSYTFNGLTSDTTYYMIVENFNVNNIEYSGVYNISLKNKTLKKDISNNIIPKVAVNSRKNTFTLSLDGIEDDEKSISSYTYYIYDAEDIRNNNPDKKPVIAPIVRTNAGNITLEVEPAGTTEHDPNKLENGKNYVYNVLIEYYDNEKYGEFLTVNSDEFWVSGKPSISLTQDMDNSTYDSVVADLDLIDNSCTVPFSGRECYNEANEIRVVVTDRTGAAVFNDVATFEKVAGNDKILRYRLNVPNLTAGSTYKVEVTANKVDMRDGTIYAPYTFTFEDGRSTLETKKLSELSPVFKDMGSNTDHVVNTNVKLVAPEVEGEKDEVNAEYTANALKSMVVKIYQGSVAGNLDEGKLLGERVFTNNDFNLKETLYGDNAKGYTITTDGTFDLSYEYLKANDLLSKQYTIVIYTYYEDVSSYADHLSAKEIRLTYNETVYNVNPQLFMTEITDPISSYVKRTNSETGRMFSDVEGNTVVGFMVSSRFHRLGLEANGQNPTGATYYVYKLGSDGSLSKVDFYIKEDNKLKKIDKNTGIKFSNLPNADSDGNVTLTSEIYMDKGTDSNTVDDLMRRGNTYFISCEVDINGSNTSYPYNSSGGNKPYSGMYGIFTEINPVDSSKQNPIIQMYADSSDKNSITYNYNIKDIDNAIFDNSINYVINGGESKSLKLTDNPNYMQNKDYYKFKGSYKVSGLSNNDNYNIYLNEELVKYTESSLDTLLETSFDGYYDISDYNNMFSIINRSDNRVKIKVLLDEEMMNRILSYRLLLEDSQKNKIELFPDTLESCGEDDSDDINRCINIDYTDLKKAGMQTTDTSNPNMIKTSLYGYYDTGMIKWVDNASDGEFYIFQDNNTTNEKGNYIVFSDLGVISKFNNSAGSRTSIKTHYTYNRDTSKKELSITNRYGGYNISGNTKLQYGIYADGIRFIRSEYNKIGVLNSKLVKEGKVTTDNNKFSFSSITPKISKDKTGEKKLINGVIVPMTITGFDETSFKKENDKFYFYIDVWNSREDAMEYASNWENVPNIEKDTKVLRTVKYEYNPDGGNKFNVLVDGLDATTTYYFTVSAYMKNGKYTQFFDGSKEDSYETEVYSFTTGGTSLYQNLKTGYTSSSEDDTYGDRTLNSVISLTASAEELNFYLKYVVCDSESEVCDLDNHLENMMGVINKEDMDTSLKSSIALPKDFVYGKNYIYKLYAIYDKKNQNGDVTGEGKYLLNPYNTTMQIEALKEPSFIMTRKASIDSENGYVIDIGVNVKDIDRTIVGKEFTMKISGPKDLAPIMQIKDENNKWVDAPSDYKFKVIDDIIEVRYRNLKENTQYEITASADSYRNNEGTESPEETITRTYAVFSTNSYGVALGSPTMSATPNSFVATFLGGSSFDKIEEVTYKFGIWGNSEAGTIDGTYLTSEKPFIATLDDESTFRYVFNPPEILENPAFSKNGALLEKAYTVKLSFKVGSNVINLDEMNFVYSKEEGK